MPKYRFVAVDNKGKELTGSVDAATEDDAFSKIRGKSLFPTTVTSSDSPVGRTLSAGAKKASAAKGQKEGIKMPGFMQNVKSKEKMAFTRQLATLVNAGLPLVRGLKVLGRQEKNPLLRETIGDLTETIEGGSNFAEALTQHPKIFDKLYVNMVKAGEIGGVLDSVLLSLAEFMEKIQKIKNKVVSAMIYPLVILFLAILILVFLLLVIIPRFQEIFSGLMQGKPLPGLTRFVMALSENFVVVGPAILLVVVGISVGLFFAKKNEKGAYWIDMVRLKMPLFGSLVSKSAVGRFCRTLGELMEAGVPVLQALTIVGETSGNAVIEFVVRDIHDAVKEGENIAPSMMAAKVFPPMVVSMVEVGEETGELPQMLGRIADTYDDEVDNAVAGLTSVIEPLMIIFLALIVGVIVVALFLPLVEIINTLG